MFMYMLYICWLSMCTSCTFVYIVHEQCTRQQTKQHNTTQLNDTRVHVHRSQAYRVLSLPLFLPLPPCLPLPLPPSLYIVPLSLTPSYIPLTPSLPPSHPLSLSLSPSLPLSTHSRNLLPTIPVGLCQMNLHSLDLSNNRLVSLPLPVCVCMYMYMHPLYVHIMF